METKTAGGFKLITRSKSSDQQLSPPTRGVQQSLFPLRNPKSVIFISLPDVDHQDFVTLLRNSGPATVIELRKIPRFDFGPLNRQSIFDLFREQGDVYLDLGTHSWEADEEIIESRIQDTLKDRIKQERPILFLTSATQTSPTIAESIFKWLHNSGEGWEMFEVPHHGKAGSVAELSA